jgi:poly-gamma-glutamate synthesis protein (capsule biosynthesis protein)
MYAGSYLSEEDRIKDNIKIVNGISYTMLSYTTSTNGIPIPSGKDYLVDVYSKEKAKADIDRIKDKVDLIIVSIHWGIEYSNDISSEQKEIATYLSSLGVSIIVGHHPHVIEPIERINNTLVFYSLGNFVSAQDTIDRLTGMIVSLKINVTKSKETKSVSYSNVKADLIYTYNKNWANFKLIPFSEITTAQLQSCRNVYNKYVGIIKKLYDPIIVTKMGG